MPSVYGLAPTDAVTPLAAGMHPARHDEVWKALDAIAFHVDSYGAVPGADSNAAIQAAIDACSAAGGGAVTGKGRYLISNLTLPSNVVLWSPSANSYGFQQPDRGFTLASTATASGYMVTIPVDARNAGVKGVTLIGRGVVNVDQSGIYTSQGAQRCVFDHVGIYNMPMFGINLDKITTSTYGHRVTACDIFAGRRPVANLGATERVAGLRINASDCYVDGNCEIQCGDSISLDPSFRRIAVWLGPLGSANQIEGAIAELSDLGIVVEGNYNRIVGGRADLNFGHGVYVGRLTTGDPQLNRIVGVLGLSNGQGTHNTYDNFHCTANGGICNGNTFSACASTSSVANKHRYGFYDSGSPATVTQLGNYFDAGCSDSLAATAAFAGVALDRMQHVSGRRSQVTITGGGTPSVVELTFVLLNDAAASNTLYTDFAGGTIGQEVTFFSIVASGVVFQHGAAIRLRGAVNKTLVAYEPVTLKRTIYGWMQL